MEYFRRINCRNLSRLTTARKSKLLKMFFRTMALMWVGVLIITCIIHINSDDLQYFTSPEIPNNEKLIEAFIIDTPGCRIPHMDLFDESVMKFIEKPVMPTCNKGLPALFQANVTSIYLEDSSLTVYNVTDPNELSCCYRAFWRTEPKDDEADNKIQYGDACYDLLNSSTIQEEFIEVSCDYKNVSIYRDMFSFVPLKNTSTASSPRTPNVLVVGMDAVSRLNLHRQMPETVSYLEQIGAVELLGYNKVGDNTFPNLIPVLTGMSEDEMSNTCWPNSKDHFDNCSFIWKDYKRRGFTTAYGEDASWMGLFNYNRRGFKEQTVDYAYNYFSRWSEKQIGNSHNMNVDECVGSRLVYRDLVDYIHKFVKTMDGNNLPYFGFFWGASISHDYLNQPNIADETYHSFFKSLKDDGHLENTVLIFMSDHGIRWGPIRRTFQGRIEERLPFVIMTLPEWYKSQQQMAYRNLRINAKRLTTPFDLHETLVDLMGPYEQRDEYFDRGKRGISFFRPISDNRTCEDAGIEPHWCTCQQSSEIDVGLPEVREAAYFAVNSMNEQLRDYAQCSRLKLDLVLNARLMAYDGKISDGDDKHKDYMLTLRTLPGEGVFEVTLRYNETASNKYSVIGTISRLNLYGKQSSCITDFHLKLYCFCKSLFSFWN